MSVHPVFWTVFHEDLKNVKLTKVRPCPKTPKLGMACLFNFAEQAGWAKCGPQRGLYDQKIKMSFIITIEKLSIWESISKICDHISSGHLYDNLLTTLQRFPSKTYKIWISSTTNIWCQLLLLWFSLAFRIFVM